MPRRFLEAVAHLVGLRRLRRLALLELDLVVRLHLDAPLHGAEGEVGDEVDEAGALAVEMDRWIGGMEGVSPFPECIDPDARQFMSVSSSHRRSSTKQAARLQMQARHCMALLQRMIW